MDPKLRAAFNADFASDKYDALVRCVNETEKWPADFRISETPVFLTRQFTDELTRAANEIVAATRTPEFASHSAAAVPKDLEVPNESAHPSFHIVDFAICAEGDRLVPRLIELQAFPSLFGFQLVLLDCIRKAYSVIPRNWTSSFGGIKDDAYLEFLRRTIIANSPVESVVLLEIQPEKGRSDSGIGLPSNCGRSCPRHRYKPQHLVEMVENARLPGRVSKSEGGSSGPGHRSDAAGEPTSGYHHTETDD